MKIDLTWKEPVPIKVPDEILSAAGGHPLIAESLFKRGIATPENVRAFLNPRAYLPADPFSLPDMDKAVDRLESSLRRGEHIGIWGDFDVDGQTSTTLLFRGLSRLNANVSYHIPVRQQESHGISLTFLETFISSGVDLLLTCDTGVSAHPAIRLAAARGIDTIITDHHTLPPELPDALAVINPQRLPEAHALHPLCGVGAAYMLLKALYRVTGHVGDEAEFLDLVALGTIADVASLTGENRYLVQMGFENLRSCPRPAIATMLSLAGVQTNRLNEEHVAFLLAPRLNALGRLADPNPIVPFLSSEDPAIISPMAIRLEGLNARRKYISDQVFKAAQDQLESNPCLLDYDAIVLHHPSWPAGVIGIVASRLVELYGRPTLLISSPAGEIARGSARSIDGINITDILTQAGGCLEGYGGHAMAAGFSIQPDRITEFRIAVSSAVREVMAKTEIVHEIAIDAYLPIANISQAFVEDIQRLAPFGAGNPAVILAARDLEVVSSTAIGKSKEHALVNVIDETGKQSRVLWWQGAGFPLPRSKFDLAYQVRMADYRGQENIQLEWVSAREITSQQVISLEKPFINIVDYRMSEEPEKILREIDDPTGLLIWSEGQLSPPANSVSRLDLKPCHTLVIWTCPPSLPVLESALQICRPGVIAVFGITPSFDAMDSLVNQMAGFAKYAITHRDGWLTISKIAAKTGHTPQVISACLNLLAAMGTLSTTETKGDQERISPGGRHDLSAKLSTIDILKSMLSETAAFRRFYRKADIQALLENILKFSH